MRIPTVALSQMSRDSEKGAAVHESHDCKICVAQAHTEQDADAVLFLYPASQL